MTSKIKKDISDLTEYSNKLNEDFEKGELSETLKQFLEEMKIDELVESIAFNANEYSVEKIVFEDNCKPDFVKSDLLLEWQQYKKIPKTNLTYRYDVKNTNTKTKNHIHVFQGKNQLYAINRDGSNHDDSRAKLGSKEIKFLKKMGFDVPLNGILEWITLDNHKDYTAIVI